MKKFKVKFIKDYWKKKKYQQKERTIEVEALHKSLVAGIVRSSFGGGYFHRYDNKANSFEKIARVRILSVKEV